MKLDPANRLALEATGIAAIRGNRPDTAVGIFDGMNRVSRRRTRDRQPGGRLSPHRADR
ncbi:hypothetical protein [Burkholderia cepacia]|uniref:hypothetical protein n=1 Tax=Burkholderia cepacia TaxID=292 RepID=UPI001CF44F1F|nr:hypothetical protein [Burkholderia cepacia]MCA8319746.1 hypothetical protein [Burkholderia cepacia]